MYVCIYIYIYTHIGLGRVAVGELSRGRAAGQVDQLRLVPFAVRLDVREGEVEVALAAGPLALREEAHRHAHDAAPLLRWRRGVRVRVDDVREGEVEVALAAGPLALGKEAHRHANDAAPLLYKDQQAIRG